MCSRECRRSNHSELCRCYPHKKSVRCDLDVEVRLCISPLLVQTHVYCNASYFCLNLRNPTMEAGQGLVVRSNLRNTKHTQHWLEAGALRGVVETTQPAGSQQELHTSSGARHMMISASRLAVTPPRPSMTLTNSCSRTAVATAVMQIYSTPTWRVSIRGCGFNAPLMCGVLSRAVEQVSYIARPRVAQKLQWVGCHA